MDSNGSRKRPLKMQLFLLSRLRSNPKRHPVLVLLRIAAESESLAEENESLISLWLFSENRVSWRAYCGIWRRRIGRQWRFRRGLASAMQSVPQERTCSSCRLQSRPQTDALVIPRSRKISAQGDFGSGAVPPRAFVSSAATSCTSFPRTGKRSFGTREALPETEMAARGSLQSS